MIQSVKQTSEMANERKEGVINSKGRADEFSYIYVRSTVHLTIAAKHKG